MVAPEFFHVSFEGVDCPWQSILLYSSVHTAPVHEVAVVQLLVLHVATILQIRMLSCWLDQIPLEPDAIWLNTHPSRKMTPDDSRIRIGGRICFSTLRAGEWRVKTVHHASASCICRVQRLRLSKWMSYMLYTPTTDSKNLEKELRECRKRPTIRLES